MEDFEPKWNCEGEKLWKSGQAHTYLVLERAEPHRKGAAKRSTDLAREDRFRQEVDAYKRVNHPNVFKLLGQANDF